MSFYPDVLRLKKQMETKLGDTDLYRQGQRQFGSGVQQRVQAGKGDHLRTEPTFLRPQDIQKGIEYDVSKVFQTTLGGTLRILTRDDLLAFSKNIELLQDQYVKGITAKKVIDLSLAIDIRRSNEQIFMAVPLSQKEGVIHFMTNASGQNKETEHHVNVELSSYKSLMLTPKAVQLSDIKKKLVYGNLKFECSCGRHTFWYRYMASIGGYGYGRTEEGFPKEKNPQLSGVACKHVLRVMNYILSPMFVSWITKQLSKDRNTQAGLRQKTTSTDLKNTIAQQNRDFEIKNGKISQNHKKAEAELLRRAANVLKRQQKALEKQRQEEIKKVAKTQGAQGVKRYQDTQKNNDLNTLKNLLKLGQITQQQYDIFSQGVINAK